MVFTNEIPRTNHISKDQKDQKFLLVVEHADSVAYLGCLVTPHLPLHPRRQRLLVASRLPPSRVALLDSL